MDNTYRFGDQALLHTLGHLVHIALINFVIDGVFRVAGHFKGISFKRIVFHEATEYFFKTKLNDVIQQNNVLFLTAFFRRDQDKP